MWRCFRTEIRANDLFATFSPNNPRSKLPPVALFLLAFLHQPSHLLTIMTLGIAILGAGIFAREGMSNNEHNTTTIAS